MGAAVPADMAAALEAAGDAESVRKAGIEMATRLCQDLLDAGAPGLHFYTLNRSLATTGDLRQPGAGRAGELKAPSHAGDVTVVW